MHTLFGRNFWIAATCVAVLCGAISIVVASLFVGEADRYGTLAGVLAQLAGSLLVAATLCFQYYAFLRTAELAGGTIKEKGKRHYTIADMFLVGEATALAMRTNVKR